MNQLLAGIPAYLTKQISDMIAKDPSIVNLSIGEPYFKPPHQLYDHLKREMFQSGDYGRIPNRYSDSKGSPELRKEIAIRYQRLYGASIDAEQEVLVTHGAAEAIWLSILTLTSIGDEVLIPDPSYIMYETAAKMLGRIPIKLPSRSAEDFCLNINDIEAHISAKTKMIIINSPENPTGTVYAPDLIMKIHSLARRYNFYFVHDEVYDAYVFNQRKHSNIFGHQTHTDANSLLINSFSKTFSMMGWRIGWIIGNAEAISQATKLHTNLTLNLAGFHQKAAASILNDPETESYCKDHIRQLEKNVSSFKSWLGESIGFDVNPATPSGGFFLFPRITRLYEHLPEEYTKLSTRGECVAQYLLKEIGIGVIPGCIYGKSGNDYIRIAVTVEEEKLEIARQRLLALDELLLRPVISD